MKLKIYPELMVRVPQFSQDAEIITEWTALRESIQFSSNDFFEIVKDVPATKLNELPSHIYHSIWKYFNRAKYRATPYGSFASIGMVKNEFRTDDDTVIIGKEQILHRFRCWTTKSRNISTVFPIDEHSTLFSNSSYYALNKTIRYLLKENEGYRLEDIDKTDLLLNILQLCRKPIAASEVCAAAKLQDYSLLQEMVDFQLLLTDKYPNLIGQDYFQRLGTKLQPGEQAYIISEKKVLNASIDMTRFRHLHSLIGLLSTIVPDPSEDNIAEFRRRFQWKYEQKIIPLMEALDPEIGLGYGEMERVINPDDLSSYFKNNVHTDKKDKFSGLYQILFNAMQKDGQKVVKLNEIFASDTQYTTKAVPNTIGILCSVWDDQVYLDQICGPSANRLAGRFTPAAENIETFCQDLAAVEQQANPDILFFDIAYNGETDVDNVNRRKRIYPYQLSILDFDLSDDPLTLEDLYLTLVGEQLHLVSKRLNKRMVPRLSTAYNFSRSDLSLFRFLCDLQYQGLKINFDLKLSGYFPDMDFYPRIEYQNIIVSPAQWKINYGLFKDIYPQDEKGLTDYLSAKGLEGYVQTRTGDRTLLFDLKNVDDLRALLYIFKKFKNFYLEEAFKSKNPIVKNNQGESYASQLLMVMSHNSKIYDASHFPEIANVQPAPTIAYTPGTEWVYFEIFIHPYRSDILLSKEINNFLRTQKNHISHWFFVRFNEHGEHIRLRLKLIDLNFLAQVLTAFAKKLKVFVEQGIITNYRLSTYKPESDRYGNDIMDEVESHFSKDSWFVLSVLKDMLSDMDKYHLCVDTFMKVKEAGLFSESNFENLILSIVKSLTKEHGVNSEGFKKLNQHYKNFKSHENIHRGLHIGPLRQQFVDSLITVLLNCPHVRRGRLLIDLMHMHINRLFAENQRVQEMIIYYYMDKELRYLKHQNIAVVGF